MVYYKIKQSEEVRSIQKNVGTWFIQSSNFIGFVSNTTSDLS